ncbi:methyltransferase-like protein 22 isoform X2 [Pararge aegeria]|uniref:methyltransferase-like protein 22 isoform X2 n=1 Tax=Pararge aegeria TaxID=116150 RepID=UPI0019D0B66D|nr:methyltransferase-like protein 22 isoform X2 [Pararge aegeria]
MPEYTVTSEIYGEYDYKTGMKPSREGNVISEFPFLLPKGNDKAQFDEDSDLDIERPQRNVIKIEHSSKTNISLVGLQVWRGAFLLGDLLIHLGLNGGLSGKTVLELGAGTGLTSFVAAIYAKKVVCTDIDLGGILELIKLNAKYNSKLIKSQFKVMPLDFTSTDWNVSLLDEIKRTDVIIASDVTLPPIRQILLSKPARSSAIIICSGAMAIRSTVTIERSSSERVIVLGDRGPNIHFWNLYI